MSSGNNFIQMINTGLSIAIIYYTVKVYNHSKTNPLVEQTEDSSQPTRALYSTPTPYQLDNYLGKYCQCGEEILDNICTEEQIISGCYDVSKNDEKAFLRSLSNDIDCTLYNSKLNGHKYSEVFNLGFDMVHKMALGILIVYICIVAMSALIVIVLLSTLCCGEKALVMLVPCLPCILVIGFGSGITDLVLHIILMVNYYKGDTTGEFLDYYDKCLQGTQDQHIINAYNTLKQVDYDMTVFVVLNFIGIFFNCFGTGANKATNNNEN